MTYEGRKELHFRYLKQGRVSPYAEEFKDDIKEEKKPEVKEIKPKSKKESQ